MEGAIEHTGKLIWMESRHPGAQTAYSVGFIHLVDPKLALRQVDKIKRRVDVHEFEVNLDDMKRILDKFHPLLVVGIVLRRARCSRDHA